MPVKISGKLIQLFLLVVVYQRIWGDVNLAEEEGFEPPELLQAQRFSRPPHSTALPLLRGKVMSYSLRRISRGRHEIAAAARLKLKKCLRIFAEVLGFVHHTCSLI